MNLRLEDALPCAGDPVKCRQESGPIVYLSRSYVRPLDKVVGVAPLLFPDLKFNLSGQALEHKPNPFRCQGCHSPYLRLCHSGDSSIINLEYQRKRHQFLCLAQALRPEQDGHEIFPLFLICEHICVDSTMSVCYHSILEWESQIPPVGEDATLLGVW